MRSINEVFSGEFAHAHRGVVQKLRPDEFNLNALRLGYSESWPALGASVDVFILSVGRKGAEQRQIWAGFVTDVQPSAIVAGRFRFCVDSFRYVGDHDLRAVPDGAFYGNGGGGGARVYVSNGGSGQHPTDRTAPGEKDSIPDGAMERRLVWVRKNHHRFRDPVWRHWEGRCAVVDQDCDGLLVASHIHPWARSTPKEKTDPDNGLLLCSPLDTLFDRGWVSFSDEGQMLVKPELSALTRQAFGLRDSLRIARTHKLNDKMKAYLARHRERYGFDGVPRDIVSGQGTTTSSL